MVESLESVPWEFIIFLDNSVDHVYCWEVILLLSFNSPGPCEIKKKRTKNTTNLWKRSLSEMGAAIEN